MISMTVGPDTVYFILGMERGVGRTKRKIRYLSIYISIYLSIASRSVLASLGGIPMNIRKEKEVGSKVSMGASDQIQDHR